MPPIFPTLLPSEAAVVVSNVAIADFANKVVIRVFADDRYLTSKSAVHLDGKAVLAVVLAQAADTGGDPDRWYVDYVARRNVQRASIERAATLGPMQRATADEFANIGVTKGDLVVVQGRTSLPPQRAIVKAVRHIAMGGEHMIAVDVVYLDGQYAGTEEAVNGSSVRRFRT